MADPQSAITPSLIFVPSVRVDRGMGHLRRCLAAAGAPTSAVYFAAGKEFAGSAPVFDLAIVQGLAEASGVRLLTKWPESEVPTVVCDLQSAPRSAFEFLRQRSRRLVGWDEGGSERHWFPFLVDSLPHDSQPDPNIRMPGLLGLSFPDQTHRFDRPFRKVLAVFGGADPAGLTLRFLKMVEDLRNRGQWPYTLTVVRGPLSRFIAPPDTEVLDAPPRLPQILGQWDLLVTSWGLTALESLAAGTPVLLLNPSAYHEKLSRAAGLPSFGVKRPRSGAFLSGLQEAPEAARKASVSLLRPPLDAGTYFSGYQGSDGLCPVCRTGGAVFARTEHKSYHSCPACGMEYLSAHQLPPKQYSEAYFFEDYQKQYGKTYLEDFSHIQSLGSQRLAFLKKAAGTLPRRILDVGCAYGPFLAAVAGAGAEPFGLDVAEGAVEYVSKTLGFPAVKASVLDFRWEESFPGKERPEALTLWYVIEHFSELDQLLRQASATLPMGGIFAFSTPNGRGITRRFNPAKFWRESPDDHFSIWNPANTRPVLKRFGFEVLAFRITGHHPERFPGVGAGKGPAYQAVARLSQWLGWGDTFEVYARKTKELA